MDKASTTPETTVIGKSASMKKYETVLQHFLEYDMNIDDVKEELNETGAEDWKAKIDVLYSWLHANADPYDGDIYLDSDEEDTPLAAIELGNDECN